MITTCLPPQRRFPDLSPRLQDKIFAAFVAKYGFDWAAELEDGGISSNWLAKWREHRNAEIEKLGDRGLAE